MFATKNSPVFAGIAAAVVVAIVVSLGYHLSPMGSSMETFFFALGGKLPNGFIQIVAFGGFFTALFSLQAISNASISRKPLTTPNCCPNPNSSFCTLKTWHASNSIPSKRNATSARVTDLIKQTATKFRSNNSPADALEITKTVSALQYKALEKEFWLVGICQTLIPTFGFLGTVWGLASAILSLGSIKPVSMAANTAATGAVAAPPSGQVALSAGDIETLVDHMGMAFFATMLAIALSLVVVVLSKKLEARVEEFHLKMQGYVVENLVNRIQL